VVRASPGKQTTLPTLTFDGKLILHGSKRTVELRETGEGHTQSDLVLYLPKENIVFMGDLLFVERHPWLGDGFVDQWIETLRTVQKWGVVSVVPGHGPVGSSGDLLTMAEYITEYLDLARKSVTIGKPEEEFARTPVPPRFRHWLFENFVPANLHYLHQSVSK
jgi:cyclase